MKICNFGNIGCVVKILGVPFHSCLSVWKTASFMETTVRRTIHPNLP